LHDKALLAFREAVREVIERHRKEKHPLAIWDWKKEKVIFVEPKRASLSANNSLTLVGRQDVAKGK
jgi:hypothetical protein